MTLTEQMAARLDDCIIENFADLYVIETELKALEKKFDLDQPEVIAALATCADIAQVQQRLITRPPAALVKGIPPALKMKLREPALLLARALLDGAQRAMTAPPYVPPKGKVKALPLFATPAWLPPLGGDLEAFVRVLQTTKEPPETKYSDGALAQLGRALVLGWLSHGADPKHVWAAHAAAYFPDDTTARDLGMMARELGPRVGQFSKAQVLVDVLAAMNTRAATKALHELATRVKTKSVKDRARAAFDAAAKRTGISEHDLADKLIGDTVGNDFVKRLEQRMVERTPMRAVEFVENILQRDTVRERARGVVFAAQVGSKVAPFTIVDDALVDLDGDDYELPAAANVIVVHPVDLPPKQLAKWQAKITGAPFAQLDRPVERFASTRALAKHLGGLKRRQVAQGRFFALENFGWKRGATPGGTYRELTRELDGLAVTIEIDPGVHVGRGMGAVPQRIVSVDVDGKASTRAMAEVARELDTLSG